ncbi:MAG: hypothetical protein FWC77_00400 [Defluviitaleaceae bacterium]|nr:hypothetical protein [Defluviitaleaceae bacterium]
MIREKILPTLNSAFVCLKNSPRQTKAAVSLIAILVIAAFIVIVTCSVSESNIPEEPLTAEPVAEERLALSIMTSRWSAADSDIRLLQQSYILTQVEQMYSMLELNAYGEYIYPDFFGGMYIRELQPNWQLVILVVESMLYEAVAHDAFSQLITCINSFEFVQFSFAELMETQRYVTRLIGERPDCIYAQSVHTYEVSMPHNRLNIFFKVGSGGFSFEEAEEMMAGFTQYVFDSPMVDVRTIFYFEFGWPGTRWPPLSFIALSVWVGIWVAVIITLIIMSARKRTKPLSEEEG